MATVTATIQGAWGGWTGSVAATPTVNATVLGAWGGMTGTAAATTQKVVVALGAWGGWDARAAAVKVEPIDAWVLVTALPATAAHRTASIVGVSASYSDVPIIDGSVTVANDRDERRTFDMTIDGTGIVVGPDGLWYDSVVRIYRSVEVDPADLAAASGPDLALLLAISERPYQLGTFLIDTIEQPHFPNQIHIAGRDFTKKLMLAKFNHATTWALSHEQLDPTGFTMVEILLGVIEAGGYGDITIYPPATGPPITLPVFTYEAGTSLWTALKEVTESQGYDLWYDPSGLPIAAPFVDPSTSPVVYDFLTGAAGNLAAYTKSTDDSQIFNHVIVTGITSDDDRLPVFGEFSNTAAGSPTRIARLGERLMKYDSAFVDTDTKAMVLARQMLRIAALESFVVDMDTLVLPWLEVNTVISFTPPDPDPGDPVNFLLTNLEIPLGLGTMKVTGKRIQVVS